MKKNLLSLIIFTLFVHQLFASGYQVRLQGQRQTTFGLIGTPMVFGSSGIFYNPGTISFMEHDFDLSLGTSFIFSSATFQKSGTDYQAHTDSPVKPPPYFYAAKKLNDKLTIGIGFYTPFGSTSVWEDDWAGRMLVQNISLAAYYVQPTIAYKISDRIGIGIGLVYATGKVELQKGLPYSADANAYLEGTTDAWGFNAGLFWKVTDKFSFGVDYRSKVQMDMVGGDATFNIPLSLQTTVPPTNTFDAGLPMPANLDFGAAYKFNSEFTLALEFNYVFWGVYDELSFTFGEKGELLNSVNPRKYENRMVSRIAGEYIMNDQWTFRAGAYYDPSPAHDDYFTPETVTLNTIAFTFGATYKPNDKLLITFSYLQTNGVEADKSYIPANFSGTYKTIAVIPGIGISYRF